jgi:hypothetical protein
VAEKVPDPAADDDSDLEDEPSGFDWELTPARRGVLDNARRQLDERDRQREVDKGVGVDLPN